jgi:hypothetical protein
MDIDFRPLLWACFIAGAITAAIVFGIGKLVADHLSVGVH